MMTEQMTEMLAEMMNRFDDEAGMITIRSNADRHSYHSKKTGIIHPILGTADLAVCIMMSGREELYPFAFSALNSVCSLQDLEKESPTFGLWAFCKEENLDEMAAPDYNAANFVGRDLLAVCLLRGELLPEQLKDRLHDAIHAAAECTIRRNVAADYTNIALMGSLTLIAAGELLDEQRFFETGRERLRKLVAYTRFNTAFSEYNSSTYTFIAIEEISRMLAFFRDSECREMANELNHYAWEMLARHYNTALGQLTPPQARAYVDVERGALASVIYLGTGGRYGKLNERIIGLPSLSVLKYVCPEDLIPLFEEKERFVSHTYYRPNDIRQIGEDLTIIRELDSPELTANSYQTTAYSMGVFDFCDTWNQRRNAMVIWGKEHPRTFRLRGIHNGYDFCSGVTWAKQNKNEILGAVGLVTDRGSLHYILDKNKSGIYEVEELGFRFELGGESEGVTIRQEGKDFFVDDAQMHIRLHVEKWVFNGKEVAPKLDAEHRAVILPGYEGEKITLDTNKLNDTYGVFSIQVSYGEIDDADAAIEMKLLPGGWLESAWQGMTVRSCRGPVTYRRALGLDGLDYDTMNRQINTILEKMKGMEADGTVQETCPISIRSMDCWEWPQGVALFAMYQYYRQTGEKSVLEYLKNWFDKQIAKGLPEQNINTTCPMLTLACIYEEERDEKYLPLLEQWLDGVMHSLPRTKEGGLQHVTTGILNEGQLWDDTLYMTVMFLARMGRVLHNESYIQESVRQFMIHIKYLSDLKTGLFFHGWTFCGNHHCAEALWGRGNSWYTAGLVDYLECLEGNEGVKDVLLTTLLRQVEALEACQHESGLWHTILDDEDSYLETSASCAFAYGILKAVRMGCLPARFVQMGEKAVKGVMSQIAEDGTVGGVSYGTPVFNTIQEYKDIPICPMPYGQSMALMMLVEASK